jgi:hypothetical protein
MLAAYGHTDCVRLLLEAGADKKVKDEVRKMSLHVTHHIISSWRQTLHHEFVFLFIPTISWIIFQI